MTSVHIPQQLFNYLSCWTHSAVSVHYTVLSGPFHCSRDRCSVHYLQQSPGFRPPSLAHPQSVHSTVAQAPLSTIYALHAVFRPLPHCEPLPPCVLVHKSFRHSECLSARVPATCVLHLCTTATQLLVLLYRRDRTATTASPTSASHMCSQLCTCHHCPQSLRP